jgi:hypothetical protein
MDVLAEIEQTEPGQRMPCGGILHAKGLTWAQAIELKNDGRLFANLTNEFKPGNGEGMDKYTYAIYTSPAHVARLEGHLTDNQPQQRQLSLLGSN